MPPGVRGRGRPLLARPAPGLALTTYLVHTEKTINAARRSAIPETENKRKQKNLITLATRPLGRKALFPP